MFLRVCFLEDSQTSEVGGSTTLRYVRLLNAFLVALLLGTAFVWMWLSGTTRPIAREFSRRGRLHGSVPAHLWNAALRVVAVLPWLLPGIVGLGAVMGLVLGGLCWWWLGPPAALLGASLAPACAGTVSHWRLK